MFESFRLPISIWYGQCLPSYLLKELASYLPKSQQKMLQKHQKKSVTSKPVFGVSDKVRHIMITCPCNVYPFTPHFYIVKLGLTGVFNFFLQATLVTSTMHSSTLPLTSTQTSSPNIFPYMFIAFQQRIIRTTVSSSKRVIRHQFLVPIMNFRSFFNA